MRSPPQGWMQAVRPALLTALLCGAAGCGAGDEEAPVYEDGPFDCPTMADKAPTLTGLLEADALPGLSGVLGEVVRDDQLAAALDGTLRLVKRLSAEELSQLASVAGNPALQGALGQAEGILHLLQDGPGGVRAELFEEMIFLMQTCEGGRAFDAISGLSDAPEIATALEALGATLELPEVQALLSGEGPDPSALSRPGFNALVGNMMLKLAEPGYSFEQDVVQPLRSLDILPMDEPPMLTLMSALSAIMGPERGVQRAMADMVCCSFYGTPSCATGAAPLRDSGPIMRDLLYDVLLSESGLLASSGGEHAEGDLFESLGSVADDHTLEAALKPLGTVLAQVAEDADLRAALVDLNVTLMRPENMARILPDVEHLLTSGAGDELFALFGLFGGECAE